VAAKTLLISAGTGTYLRGHALCSSILYTHTRLNGYRVLGSLRCYQTERGWPMGDKHFAYEERVKVLTDKVGYELRAVSFH
jgi:hypothetical protein